MNLKKIKFTLKKITFYVACTPLLSHVHAGDDLMFDKNRFPHTPMHGTFIVVQTIPDLRKIPENQYYSSVFMPQQRVKFEYDGEVGTDWEGRFEYNMTIFPPYNRKMCKQDHWLHYCNEIPENPGMPARPITQTLILSASQIENQNDISELIDLVPYGLKLKDYIYSGNTSDGGVTYDSLYFKDWNTLISTTAYSDADLRSKSFRNAKIRSAIQILKRIDENTRIPYRPMVR